MPASPSAALLRLGASALSHQSAARVHGIELLQDDGTRHLTVPLSWSHARLDGWVVTSLADLSRVLSLQAVEAADSAVRTGLVTVPDLLDLLLGARGPGVGRLRAVGRHVDPLSGLVIESAARVELWLAGLPPPVLQHEVRTEHGRLVARVDLAWPQQRLLVEVDGFAFHSDRVAYRRDREKMNDLERLGWRVLRVT